MKSVAVPNGEIRYVESGSGSTVLLLHGGSLDHRMWDYQLPDLEEDYRLVRPDARGHGKSSTPTAPFRHCDDVAALVRHLDAGPVHIVGLSMGGAIAIDTALEYPELVRSLVISGCGTGEPHFNDPWLNEKVLSEWARAQETRDAERWVEAFALLASGPDRSLDEVDGEVVSYCREAGMETIVNHAGRPDWVPPGVVSSSWDRLSEIDVPLLAIVGGVDSSDHIGMSERVAESVADGSLTTIACTAHYPNMERPREFNAAVQSFLRRSRSTT